MAYSYESFRTYLEDEILQSTAAIMGWVDVEDPIAGSKTAQGVYDAITNEVCLQMNYASPDLVPDEDLLEMRAIGRIEAWRAVAFNTMADSDINLGDSSLNRSQVNGVALNQLDLAEAEYKQKFGTPTTTPVSPRAATYSVENEWRF